MSGTDLEFLKTRLEACENELNALKEQTGLTTEQLAKHGALGKNLLEHSMESTANTLVMLIMIEKLGFLLTQDRKITGTDLLQIFRDAIGKLPDRIKEHSELARDLVEASWELAAEADFR